MAKIWNIYVDGKLADQMRDDSEMLQWLYDVGVWDAKPHGYEITSESVLHDIEYAIENYGRCDYKDGDNINEITITQTDDPTPLTIEPFYSENDATEWTKPVFYGVAYGERSDEWLKGWWWQETPEHDANGPFDTEAEAQAMRDEILPTW